MAGNRALVDQFADCQSDVAKRWRGGVPHHPEALEFFAALKAIDAESDSLFKVFAHDSSYDLLYLLDVYFERQGKEG